MARYISLTRQEKEACVAYGLDWKMYGKSKDVDRYNIQIVHKETGETKVINKYRKPKKGEKHAWQM